MKSAGQKSEGTRRGGKLRGASIFQINSAELKFMNINWVKLRLLGESEAGENTGKLRQVITVHYCM